MESDIINIQQEEKTTLDSFIKKLEENSHKDENGIEYWSARDLQKILEYSKWEKFCNVIDKAKIACNETKQNIENHFHQVGKMVQLGSDSSRIVEDYNLTRYACYLIAQNADVKKKIVAFAQAYFAVQTRRQEIYDLKSNQLTENQQRILLRTDIKKHHKDLKDQAQNAGVSNYGVFFNSGYRGLYNGEKKEDIAKRKGLNPKDDIYNYMSSEELASNMFRITQTTAKMQRENIKGEYNANKTHFEVGQKVRKAIEDIGGTMPENLPTPPNIKQIEKEQKKLEKEKLKKLK